MSKQTAAEARIRLGRTIRRLREEQGFSLRQFGLMVDVDYTHLFAIEHGTANATVNTLARIAAGLDVDIAILFSNNT